MIQCTFDNVCDKNNLTSASLTELHILFSTKVLDALLSDAGLGKYPEMVSNRNVTTQIHDSV